MLERRRRAGLAMLRALWPPAAKRTRRPGPARHWGPKEQLRAAGSRNAEIACPTAGCLGVVCDVFQAPVPCDGQEQGKVEQAMSAVNALVDTIIERRSY